jgi:hypothetical protein
LDSILLGAYLTDNTTPPSEIACVTYKLEVLIVVAVILDEDTLLVVTVVIVPFTVKLEKVALLPVIFVTVMVGEINVPVIVPPAKLR